MVETGEERLAVGTQSGIVSVYHDLIEELVNRSLQRGKAGKHFLVVAGFEVRKSGGLNLIDGGGERLFGVALEKRRIDLGRDFALDLLQDVDSGSFSKARTAARRAGISFS